MKFQPEFVCMKTGFVKVVAKLNFTVMFVQAFFSFIFIYIKLLTFSVSELLFH